jgi:hypothetical protein
MKFKITHLAIVIFCSTLIVSCSKKKSSLEDLIPNDAKVVFTINADQLMQKLAKNGISADDFPDGILENLTDSSTSITKPFFKNIDSIGIDFKQPSYVAISVSDNNLVNNASVRFIAAVQSREKITAYFKKLKATIETDGSLTFISYEDMMIGMDDKFMVSFKDFDGDKLIKKNTLKSANTEYKEFTDQQLKDAIKGTFSTKSKSLTDNKDYTKLAIGTNDVKIWMNQSFFIENNSSENTAAQAAAYMKKLFEGSSSTTLLNFDNGKVVAQNQTYFNKDVAAIIKKSASKEIDLSLLNNYSGKNLNGMIGFSIEPSMFLDMIKYTGNDGLMNGTLGLMKLSSDDIFSALTGDGVMVISDINESNINSKKAEGLNMAVIAKVKNKANLDKLMALPNIAKSIKQVGNIYLMKENETSEPIYLAITNEVLIISPTKLVVENYIADTNKYTIDPTIAEKLKGKSGGYYFNMSSIMQIAMQSQKGKLDNLGLGTIGSQAFNMFKETYMTAGKFTDNYIQTDGVLIMGNYKQNSLAYMIKQGVQVGRTVMSGNASSNVGENNYKDAPDDTIKPMQVK